jgi:oxygen-independent coproporphyrinogen-3 oxidase
LLYREARDLLLAHGYEQTSMRCFQKVHEAPAVGPVYCCQTDAMLGLGCGARSYTTRLHYSSRFAVDSAGVHAILDAWTRQSDADFREATWGCLLSEEDRRRRFVVQSLLTCAGLDESELERLFHVRLTDVGPALTRWIDEGLVEQTAGRTRLTPLGLELSDWMGPFLYSPSKRALFERFALS